MPEGADHSRKWLAVALLALAASACAAASPGPPPGGGDARIEPGDAGHGIVLSTEMSSSSVTLQHSADRTWTALRSTFAELEIPYTEDAGETTLGHPGFRARRIAGNRMSRYFDCGSSITGAIADSYQVTVTIRAAVHSMGPGMSEVLTTLDAVATSRASRTGELHCTSTGALERLIMERVEAMLGT